MEQALLDAEFESNSEFGGITFNFEKCMRNDITCITSWSCHKERDFRHARHKIYSDEMREIVQRLFTCLRFSSRKFKSEEAVEILFGSLFVMSRALQVLDNKQDVNIEILHHDARFNFLSGCLITFLSSSSERNFEVNKVKIHHMKTRALLTLLLVSIYYDMYFDHEKKRAHECNHEDIECVNVLQQQFTNFHTTKPLCTPMQLLHEVDSCFECRDATNYNVQKLQREMLENAQLSENSKKTMQKRIESEERIESKRALNAQESNFLQSGAEHADMQVFSIPSKTRTSDCKAPVSTALCGEHFGKQVVFNTDEGLFGLVGDDTIYVISHRESVLRNSFAEANIFEDGHIITWESCQQERKRFLGTKVSFSTRFSRDASVSFMQMDASLETSAGVVVVHHRQTNNQEIIQLKWPISVFKTPLELEFQGFHLIPDMLKKSAICGKYYSKEKLKVCLTVNKKSIMKTSVNVHNVLNFQPPTCMTISIIEDFCSQCHGIVGARDRQKLRKRCYDILNIVYDNLTVMAQSPHMTAAAIFLKSTRRSDLHQWLGRYMQHAYDKCFKTSLRQHENGQENGARVVTFVVTISRGEEKVMTEECVSDYKQCISTLTGVDRNDIDVSFSFSVQDASGTFSAHSLLRTSGLVCAQRVLKSTEDSEELRAKIQGVLNRYDAGEIYSIAQSSIIGYGPCDVLAQVYDMVHELDEFSVIIPGSALKNAVPSPRKRRFSEMSAVDTMVDDFAEDEQNWRHRKPSRISLSLIESNDWLSKQETTDDWVLCNMPRIMCAAKTSV